MSSKLIVNSLLSYNGLTVFHQTPPGFPTMGALVHSIFSFPLKPLHYLKLVKHNRLWEPQKGAEGRA